MSKFAYRFPGQAQGSVKVGMGKEICFASEQAKIVYDFADRQLNWPRSLSTYCFFGPAADLQEKTEISQLASLTTNVAHLAYREDFVEEDLVEDHRFMVRSHPDFVTGHSVGIYPALVMAEVIDFATAIKVVQKRAVLMSAASKNHPGRMLVLLDYANLYKIEQLCLDTGVVIANYNSDSQIVVSGSRIKMDRFEEKARNNKMAKRFVPLKTEGGFHSLCMDSAVEPFANFLESIDFFDAKIPVVANTASVILTKGEEIKQELARQINSPVKWTEIENRLMMEGVTKLIEIGHGRVLTDLISKSKMIKTSILALTAIAFATLIEEKIRRHRKDGA